MLALPSEGQDILRLLLLLEHKTTDVRIIYSIGISLYTFAVHVASPFNVKARQMCEGWRRWREKIPSAKLDGQRVAWFHASSLGEFEQARPIIEAYNRHFPDHRIVVTFFSPSGYEIRKNYNLAATVMYLPPDTRRNARDLIRLIHPDVSFFVKYDFWFNYIHQLDKASTPTYLVDAIFRPTQYFFKWYGRWFAKQLKCYTHFFVQNEESVSLLNSVGITQATLTGDTRFDRVDDIAKQSKQYPVVERFVGNGVPVLMAGSSWEPDEENIKKFLATYSKPLKTILAPHVISESHLQSIEKLFGADNCVRYSALNKNDAQAELFQRPVLIIDNIGMLSSLYRYATIAYIGGGFGKGIHNTLEAAIFGIPVCFGPNHTKFQEAQDLMACGAAKSYDIPQDLQAILRDWLDNSQSYTSSANASKQYMHSRLGATNTIMERILHQ